MVKGKFIVIEGVDGAGKSTQIKKLQEFFGERVLVTREPGGSEFGEVIRDLALKHPLAKEASGKTQFCLMWASRADHLDKKIRPAINNGVLVISDRFDSSTFAYNISGQKEVGMEDLFWNIREIVLGDLKPDLYIFLDLDPKIGMERQNRDDIKKDHFDERDAEFKNRVRGGYLEFLDNKKIPSVVVDASGTIDEVFEKIIEQIK